MSIAICRSVVLYLILIIGIRLMGKRQVGELEPSELVLALLVADLASVPMQDFGIPLVYGIIPILTLLCVTMILSVLTTRSIRFRSLLCGQPSIIVRDGELDQREMRRNRITIDELNEELRLNGILDLSTVKYAILETNGHISTILFPQAQPVTAGQLDVRPERTELPWVIINDGRLISRNLYEAGLDRNWLDRELERRQVREISEVFLLSVDRKRHVQFIRREGVWE
ncbi:MAG: DUF421 domain-containing protein [Oscillospiraceae bacterium]|nr:DUF421 domain-containing protein [Oscillospiraceae bacterium]